MSAQVFQVYNFTAALYATEFKASAQSAFLTHGVSTWAVLFGGWSFFCAVIDWLGSNVASIKASKLQSHEKTDDPQLRELATRTVIRNWIAVLAQTVCFAPFLKAAFPLRSAIPAAEAMSLAELAVFFIIWFVSNDLIFTIFHATFHEIPWLYKFAHKEHHTWKAPYVWMSHAMSLTEMAANAVGVMFYPFFHTFYLGRTTPLELVWFVQLVSQVIGCVEHSGYDAMYPLVLVNPKYFPSWMLSTTRHHDDHHKYFKGNYGGYIAIWDVLLGTVIEPGQTSYLKSA
jgi:sterol desaturase/sphingolipid hydroxylase (fatty acid hydroxylase superfamily)